MRSRSKRHALDKAGRDALLILAADFLGACPAEILAAYAFGSFARAEPFSDLDVALLMATWAPEPLAFELSLEGNLEKLVRIPVDVRIGTPIRSTKIPALSPIAHGWQGKIAFSHEHPHASLASAADGPLRKV